MSSKKCYARFKIFKDDLNIEEYEIIFLIKERKLSTKKMKLIDGMSIDAAATLLSNGTIKNCNAFVNFYKSNRLLNSKPLLLKVSDNSLKDERDYLKRARIPVTEKSYFDYLYTTFSFSVTKGNTNINPNSKKTQTIQSINKAPSIPYGLRWVGFLRKQIKLAALRNNVDKLAIASIIFQEKYHGIYASKKNNISFTLTPLTRYASYGYGEMQLGLAADLMGVTKNDNPNYLEEVFNIISSNAEIAMDLIGKHLNNEQKRRGRRLTPREATVFYNAGNNALDSYINGEITQERIINSIYGRSWEWQNAIRMALEGLIVGQPDNCVLDSCNAYMEQDLSAWTNNLSMTVQY